MSDEGAHTAGSRGGKLAGKVSSNLNIPTLSAPLFRESHIRNNTDELFNDDNIEQFFIHSFKDDDVHLDLPLPPHKKTVNDLVFITSGSMTRNLGIESFTLSKNDLLFTPKNSITTTEFVSKDLEGYYCHFSDDFVGANPFLGMLHTQPSRLNYIQTSHEEAAVLEFLLARMVRLYKTRKNSHGNYQLISYYLSLVLAELFLSLIKQVSPPSQNSGALSSFMNLVHKHFKRNLNIQDYASLLHITPNHLNKRVKSESGKTASEIVKEITILEAKVLLLQTRMSISEIGMELGFEDASYFSRLFKNQTGRTPSNYRDAPLRIKTG